MVPFYPFYKHCVHSRTMDTNFNIHVAEYVTIRKYTNYLSLRLLNGMYGQVLLRCGKKYKHRKRLCHQTLKSGVPGGITGDFFLLSLCLDLTKRSLR
jgi:hypothetical protein